MKHSILAEIILALALGLVSCNSDQSYEFQTEELWDWFYIDIPNNLHIDRDYSIKNVMLHYIDPTNHNAILSVYMKDSVSKIILQKMVDEDKQMYKKRGYNVSNYMISDSVASFKYGKGLFMGKAHYIIKDVDGFHFIVKYDGIEGRNLDVIKHIANSIRMRVKMPDTTMNEDLIYENKYFSVKYPRTWQYLEHPDAMSDVYIGLKNEQFGVIVVRFEREMNMNEINRECLNQQKALGLSVTNTKYKIAGKDGYKTISTGNIGGLNVKFIEYSFKNSNMFFDLKFGGDAKIADMYNKEMQDIVESFTLKQ